MFEIDAKLAASTLIVLFVVNVPPPAKPLTPVTLTYVPDEPRVNIELRDLCLSAVST